MNKLAYLEGYLYKSARDAMDVVTGLTNNTTAGGISFGRTKANNVKAPKVEPTQQKTRFNNAAGTLSQLDKGVNDVKAFNEIMPNDNIKPGILGERLAQNVGRAASRIAGSKPASTLGVLSGADSRYKQLTK